MAIGTSVQMQTPRHLPVMWKEVMDGLRIKADGVYLDGTFGRGGHARGILEALGPDGRLLLTDKDPDAIAFAQQHFGSDPRVALYHGSFADMRTWEQAAQGLDGVLFDLGVSSPQLDVAERGFSFRQDGPLDMRMNTQAGQSAAQWLAKASEKDITEVLWQYGEEKLSRKIARVIVEKRQVQPALRSWPSASPASLAAAMARSTPPPAASRPSGFSSTGNWTIWKAACRPPTTCSSRAAAWR
jgi:16S rRNA (cytosine1402-N4)-methyltransferase